jgi:hypothetical protein
MLSALSPIQAQMRRDASGQLLCERCGGQAQRGWIYGWGSIVLATCRRAACQPPAPWVHALVFVPPHPRGES